jgi:hypothetical protein
VRLSTKIRGREISAFLAIMLLTAFSATNVREPLVIQGRITEIQGVLLTVKTPDGYPGGPGVHAQFVVSRPALRIDFSHARVLLPDGMMPDKLPLVTGDHVLVVLDGSDGAPSASTPLNVNETYIASIVERIVQGDKVITH